MEDDLVERELDSGAMASRAAPGFWLVSSHAQLGSTLRLSRDAAGSELHPTPLERMRELEAASTLG